VMAMAMPSDILSDTLAMNWMRGSLVVILFIEVLLVCTFLSTSCGGSS
jgi:hypothetical protein